MEGLRSAIGIGGSKGAGSHTGLNLLPATKLVTLQTILTFIRQAMTKHGLPIAGAGSVRRKKVALKQTPFPVGIFEAYEDGSWSTSHPLGPHISGQQLARNRVLAVQPDPFLGPDSMNDWGIADLDWAEGAADVASWDVKRLSGDGDGELAESEGDVGNVLAVSRDVPETYSKVTQLATHRPYTCPSTRFSSPSCSNPHHPLSLRLATAGRLTAQSASTCSCAPSWPSWLSQLLAPRSSIISCRLVKAPSSKRR